MSRILWNAEHGWHETEDDYRLTLLPNGRNLLGLGEQCRIGWVVVESDDDEGGDRD